MDKGIKALKKTEKNEKSEIPGKKKTMAKRMKDGYGSGWPEHRKGDKK